MSWIRRTAALSVRDYIGETEGASQWATWSASNPRADSRYILTTLDSILVQKHRPLEILVVDDGSTHSTARNGERICTEVRLIEQQRRGTSQPEYRHSRESGGSSGFLDSRRSVESRQAQRNWPVSKRKPALDLVFGHIQISSLRRCRRRSGRVWPFRSGRCPDCFRGDARAASVLRSSWLVFGRTRHG